MRLPAVALILLAACSSQANHLGNPLLLPVSGVTTAFENARYNERRGAVEVFVKSNFPILLEEIRAGGGPIMDEAMTLARIPPDDRPARLIQMRADLGLYDTAPGALVTALMVYGT